MSQKMLFYCLCLLLQISLGIYFYVHGSHGLYEKQALDKKCATVEQACDDLSHKIACLQQDLIDWQQDPAYREQEARSRLHMGRPQEIWYRY